MSQIEIHQLVLLLNSHCHSYTTQFLTLTTKIQSPLNLLALHMCAPLAYMFGSPKSQKKWGPPQIVIPKTTGDGSDLVTVDHPFFSTVHTRDRWATDFIKKKKTINKFQESFKTRISNFSATPLTKITGFGGMSLF